MSNFNFQACDIEPMPLNLKLHTCIKHENIYNYIISLDAEEHNCSTLT